MATALTADSTFDDGWQGAFATSIPTEASVTLCFSATDHSRECAYVSEIHLATCSTLGRVVLYDGSGGNALCGLPPCSSAGGGSAIDLSWPSTQCLKTLGGDNTQTLCVSAAGTYSIFIKYMWGPKGFTTV